LLSSFIILILRAIDAEKPLKNRKSGFSLEIYNEMEDIYHFLNETQQNYSDKATLITIGESYEGRPLELMKISINENNPAIFIEANIHAREWISSATAVWIINEILTTTDPDVREIIDSVTWYILPVTNPDGKR
jgi:carboxypeptidase A2